MSIEDVLETFSGIVVPSNNSSTRSDINKLRISLCIPGIANYFTIIRPESFTVFIYMLAVNIAIPVISSITPGNKKTIQKRMEVYQEKTAPIIDYYQQLGKLRKVDAEKETQELFNEVAAIVNER